MLSNIKSLKVLKISFSYIKDIRKLNLIKYNKELKNKMNIDLIKYKIYSGTYVIIEKNGTGKEYNAYNNRLIFEGEYLNGKRNGKGKELSSDFSYSHINFEGEYLNGKRNGKGKEYNVFGDLIFEGDYLNGLRNGKGKEYNAYNNKLIFEGEYKNGKRWNGKVYDINNNIIYDFIKGQGIIKEYNRYNYLIFEGKYLNGERNGIGK